MLLSLDKGFLFLAAGKTGTSSVTAALLPYLTMERARVPFSIELAVPTHPEIEALFADESEATSSESTIRGLAMLSACRAPFEIELTNKESGFALRTSVLTDLRHVPARTARRLLGEAVWQRAVKFAFVRNPWDWVLSNYAYRNRSRPIDRMDVEQVLWVRDHVSRRQLSVPYRTQHAFLCDEDGKVRLDYVGRYETLDRDFSELAARLAIDGQLEHLNQNDERPRTNFEAFYTDEAFRMVGELWAVDVESFGYART